MLGAAVVLLAGCTVPLQLPDYSQWTMKGPYAPPLGRPDHLTICVSRYFFRRGDGDDTRRIEAGLDSEWADDRVALAVALATGEHDDPIPQLQSLVADSDAVVRRVAAEFLFGGDRSLLELADRHDFRDVLSGEAEAWSLARQIRRGDRHTQYEATKGLVALGRRATWALHLLSHDADNSVALSAIYALQEIDAVDPGARPEWWERLEKAAAMKVSFAFSEATLDEALRELSRQSGVPIRLANGTHESVMLLPINLQLTNISLALALDWITKLEDCEFVFTRSGIVVRPRMRLMRGTTPFWIDVRDLEAAGIERDWAAELNQSALTGDRWIGILERGSLLENQGGLLMLMVPCHQSDEPNYGRDMCQPILRYLKSLRDRGTPGGPRGE